MLDRETFIHTLHSIEEIANTSDHIMTAAELEQYLQGMELSPDQKSLILQHIQNLDQVQESEEGANADSAINVTSEEGSDKKLSQGNSSDDQPETEEEQRSRRFFKMYLADLEALPVVNEQELIHAYEDCFQGKQEASTVIMNYWLPKVVPLGADYKSLPLNMEDIIQEGNMGLLEGVSTIPALTDASKETIDTHLSEAICFAMKRYITETLDDEALENTILGKVALLSEAREVLTKDLGHAPSAKELSNYTQLDENEIQDILSLLR